VVFNNPICNLQKISISNQTLYTHSPARIPKTMVKAQFEELSTTQRS